MSAKTYDEGFEDALQGRDRNPPSRRLPSWGRVLLDGISIGATTLLDYESDKATMEDDADYGRGYIDGCRERAQRELESKREREKRVRCSAKTDRHENR